MAEHAAQRSGWTPERSAAGDRSPWILTGIISIATFMTVLDSHTIAELAEDRTEIRFLLKMDSEIAASGKMASLQGAGA